MCPSRTSRQPTAPTCGTLCSSGPPAHLRTPVPGIRDPHRPQHRGARHLHVRPRQAEQLRHRSGHPAVPDPGPLPARGARPVHLPAVPLPHRRRPTEPLGVMGNLCRHQPRRSRSISETSDATCHPKNAITGPASMSRPAEAATRAVSTVTFSAGGPMGRPTRYAGCSWHGSTSTPPWARFWDKRSISHGIPPTASLSRACPCPPAVSSTKPTPSNTAARQRRHRLPGRQGPPTPSRSDRLQGAEHQLPRSMGLLQRRKQ